MEFSSAKEGKPSLENLFKDLEHPNPNINRKACLKMACYWPEDSIAKLICGLNQKDVELRRKTVKALGYFGDCAISSVARLFLDNEDLIIRASCLKVFIKIVTIEHYESFPKDLIEVVDLSLKDDNPQIILLVVLLLRQLGKLGLPKLILSLKDSNILLAKASVTAIGEIDDPSAQRCLRELLEDNSLDEIIQESVFYSLANYNVPKE